MGVDVIRYTGRPIKEGTLNILTEVLREQSKLNDSEIDFLLYQLMNENLSYGNGMKRYQYSLMIYELFKKIMGIPGHIVEVGVYRGYTSMMFAHLIKIFNEPHRYYYGFDTFDSFPKSQLEGEEETAKLYMDFKDTSLELVKSLADRQQYTFMNFIKGDVLEIIPQFVKAHPYFKIALLYIDCDVYKPTKVALDNFLPCMQKGGIIAFDEYNHPMQGETKAADDVFRGYGLEVIRDSTPMSSTGYCITK